MFLITRYHVNSLTFLEQKIIILLSNLNDENALSHKQEYERGTKR